MSISQSKIRGSLMIQGTTSDAGKSICVAGLCRLLKRRGVSVAPFKPQNMALNSAVTDTGGEIGRAQALQAAACGLTLSTDFNPVLLKPSSDMRSQVIIHGKAVSQLEAEKFGDIKSLAFDAVLASYQRLKDQYDVVLIEGAGSPAEINLRDNDIANMGFAEAADCPVVLIGDINRGGVFAHLTGTVNLLSPSEQNRIKGFIINQFRGHLALLQGGLDWLEDYSHKPVLGVLPFIPQLKLDAEDAINAEQVSDESAITIKIPVLPRISNHTDFDPLRWHPRVNLTFVAAGESLAGADLIILPGSKNVRDDLDFVLQQDWLRDIQRHLRYGGKLLGICGGFQMLGDIIHDPAGVETSAGSSKALSLLKMETTLTSQKQLTQVTGCCHLSQSLSSHLSQAPQNLHREITGYEIHCGISQGSALASPFATVRDQDGKQIIDGAISDDGQIVGTYIHGLFESKDSLTAILQWAGAVSAESWDWSTIREQELERLADVFEAHLDVDKILAAIG